MDKLGPIAKLVPAVPAVTRYKKEVVAKQEKVEMEMAKGSVKKKSSSDAFLESVPRVSHTSCMRRIWYFHLESCCSFLNIIWYFF